MNDPEQIGITVKACDEFIALATKQNESCERVLAYVANWKNRSENGSKEVIETLDRLMKDEPKLLAIMNKAAEAVGQLKK